MKAGSSARRGGWSTLLALAVAGSFAAMVSVGMRARARELTLPERNLCRARARWAAESAIARGRGQLAARGSATAAFGELEPSGPGVRYTLAVERAGEGLVMRAEGACTSPSGGELRHTVRAVFTRPSRDWVLSSWDEASR